MKRTLLLVIAVVLATPLAGLAQQQPEILQSAERAALRMELQQLSDTSARRRSIGRTAAGVSMIAVGGLLATATATRRSCSGGPCTSETEWYKPLGYPGVALVVTGGLLATVWSDIPAVPHIGRRSIGRTSAGVSMIAVGSLLATANTKTTLCILDSPCISDRTWNKPVGYTGAALVVTGVLLATVWSDAPANPHINFTVTPDRIQVGKTFGF